MTPTPPVSPSTPSSSSASSSTVVSPRTPTPVLASLGCIECVLPLHLPLMSSLLGTGPSANSRSTTKSSSSPATRMRMSLPPVLAVASLSSKPWTFDDDLDLTTYDLRPHDLSIPFPLSRFPSMQSTGSPSPRYALPSCCLSMPSLPMPSLSPCAPLVHSRVLLPFLVDHITFLIPSFIVFTVSLFLFPLQSPPSRSSHWSLHVSSSSSSPSPASLFCS